ncbi:MAG TPA: electron transport complex subunit RsxG [Marinagarivorans sp.]
MLGQSITKNSLILGAFAAATAAIIAITFQSTKTRILQEERKAASAALIDMVPASRHDNDMLADTLWASAADSRALGFDAPVALHVAKLNGKTTALIIPSLARDGYSGDIKLIIAINTDGTLAGARVLAHKETPGLGDKIDLRKSPWMHSFKGLSLTTPPAEQWKVKKDGGVFDQFTGATITPRAVIKRIKSTLELYQQRRTEWLDAAKILPQQESTRE